MNKNKNIKILAFDGNMKLVGIFNSCYSASMVTNICHQMINKACTGEIISAKGFYWREVDPEYVVDSDDLGVLTLIQFDSYSGTNRQVYATRRMKKNEVIWESEYNKRFTILRQRQKKLWEK